MSIIVAEKWREIGEYVKLVSVAVEILLNPTISNMELQRGSQVLYLRS
ncbi:hypothetical protein ACO0K7_12680 [Undibacterium sp. Ji67W]